MKITRRRVLATALLTAGAVTASGTPASAIPRDVDHVRYWNNVLIRAWDAAPTGGGDGLARATAMLNAALHDTAVSLGAPGTPVVARVPKIAHFSYDRDMNLDAAAYAVLRAILPNVDFSRDFAIARATPPLGEPGPEGWSVSVGEGAARQVLDARPGHSLR